MKKYIILFIIFISCIAKTSEVSITYRDGISGIDGSKGDIEFNISGASFNREVQVSLGSEGEFTPEVFRESRVFSYKNIAPGDYTYTIATRSTSSSSQSSLGNNSTSTVADLAATNNSKSGVISVRLGVTTVVNFKL